MSNYAKEYYKVPADIGRKVTYNERPGIIYKDGGTYVAVNFDDEKPGLTHNIHPTDPGLKYLGIGEIRKMTRSQQRYRRYLEWNDCFDSFLEFCYWDSDSERPWNQ